MRYDYLTDDEKKQLWQQREQELMGELHGLERQHYEATIDYRIAARKNPVDETGQTTAQAQQAELDAQHDALNEELQAIPQRRGGGP